MAVHHEKKQKITKGRDSFSLWQCHYDRSKRFLLAKMTLLLVEELGRFLYDIGGLLLVG
ncbi:hypothetical protein TorRG33x02_065050 [Trema orientale]|uniref:Uncharacterized protein n=1 Tax=Trema orientale TaxID=63057 RepID=A0A2P5FIG1_TREOI|nr:hypothetical protein TorRG33x02_065050 [Trema orientale]